METSTKKIFVISVGLLICLYLTLSPLRMMGTVYRDSLENYSGRIVHLEEIQNINENLMVWRPYGEALSWGKDAVLGYNHNHLHLLRPDPNVAGLFQHAEVNTLLFGYEDEWKIEVSKDAVVIDWHYPFGSVSFFCMTALFLCFVWYHIVLNGGGKE